MPDRYFLRPNPARCSTEKFVALLTGKLLEIILAFDCLLFHFDGFRTKRELQAGAQAAHKILVGISFLPSDAMVQVGNCQRKRKFRSELVEAKQQSHRIRSAGNRNKHVIARV